MAEANFNEMQKNWRKRLDEMTSRYMKKDVSEEESPDIIIEEPPKPLEPKRTSDKPEALHEMSAYLYSDTLFISEETYDKCLIFLYVNALNHCPLHLICSKCFQSLKREEIFNHLAEDHSIIIPDRVPAYFFYE
ncbi:hypothetical protein X975_04458, partial [Stegodyphus mimosarum]